MLNENKNGKEANEANKSMDEFFNDRSSAPVEETNGESVRSLRRKQEEAGKISSAFIYNPALESEE